MSIASRIGLSGILALFVACASTPKKVVIDSSPVRPTWMDTNKIAWDDGARVFLKSNHTVKGNERLNGCYDLARLDAKENLLSEIANDVRGRIDNAQQSISENAEVILGKVRSGQFEGQISGLRFSEQYFERYRIQDTERIDCYLLAEITLSDFNRTKQAVVNKVAEADPRLKEAIARQQIDFFARQPASSITTQ